MPWCDTVAKRSNVDLYRCSHSRPANKLKPCSTPQEPRSWWDELIDGPWHIVVILDLLTMRLMRETLPKLEYYQRAIKDSFERDARVKLLNEQVLQRLDYLKTWRRRISQECDIILQQHQHIKQIMAQSDYRPWFIQAWQQPSMKQTPTKEYSATLDNTIAISCN